MDLIDQPGFDEQLNIFFCFTPFNQLILDVLLQSPEFSGLPALVINTFPKDCSLEGVQIVNFSNRNFSKWQSLRRYRAIGRLLRQLRKRDQIASVTSPHPHSILSNELMLGKTSYPVNIYEDGLANYCPADNIDKLKVQSHQKQILAPLMGFRYRHYSGHITGLDERQFDCGYFLQPEHVYRKERFLRIAPVDMSLGTLEGAIGSANAVLVLEQDLETIFSRRQSRELRERLYARVKQLGLDVYYKPQPASSENFNLEEYGLKVTYLDSSEPAELVALRLRPRYVVSYFSSALKNIVGMLPEAVCISVGVDELDAVQGSDLCALFERIGIRTE